MTKQDEIVHISAVDIKSGLQMGCCDNSSVSNATDIVSLVEIIQESDLEACVDCLNKVRQILDDLVTIAAR